MMKRPTREQLGGYSLSEFKTLLKRLGHKVPRNLWHTGYVTQCGNHYFRWRWWSDEGFVVDRSKPIEMFDRWANSVEQSYSFKPSQKQRESE
jgi:hypothetical protein